MKRSKPLGSGRKKLVPAVKARCICLTDEQVRLLRMWGRGDVSAGLRWLIEAAAPMIFRVSNTEEKNIIPKEEG